MLQQISTQESAQGTPPAPTASKPAVARPLTQRVLFLSRSALEHVSGTPVILDEWLCQFPDGHAELLCEKRAHEPRTRKVVSQHPVHSFSFQNVLWPYRRGSRVRSFIALLGFPWLVVFGLWKVMRFRPHCIIAIYFDARWILASYLISRLSSTPLIFYVHDAFLENAGRTFSVRRIWRDRIERLTLGSARVLVLHASLATHYTRRYGVNCSVLRRIVTTKPLDWKCQSVIRREIVIGFAGAVYDSNAQQLKELAQTVNEELGVHLKIFTGTNPSHLTTLGIEGKHVSLHFENDFEVLLGLLSECDLLYLPLAFFNSNLLTTDALQYTFPTKGIDYLLVGKPILVHCPPEFELFQFFQSTNSAHLLGESGREALRAWLKAWIEGKLEPIREKNRKRALELFSVETNRQTLLDTLDEVTVKTNA